MIVGELEDVLLERRTARGLAVPLEQGALRLDLCKVVTHLLLGLEALDPYVRCGLRREV